MTFLEHRNITADDCNRIVEELQNVAKQVLEGNMSAFEKFWIEGGTEEGDAKINVMRELIVLRYAYRADSIRP